MQEGECTDCVRAPESNQESHTTLSQTQKNRAQPTHRRCADEPLLKEGSVRPRQHLLLDSLGKQQCRRAVHMAVHKSHA
jgi:hypothetical protein